jgi:flagellar motor switch protein FliN/FliY
MKSYLDCWTGAATALFSQALAGEPELAESLPKPLAPDSFGFVANITGDLAGRFAVVLDATVLDTPLVGEGMDQKAGWSELLREVAESAVGELLAATGKKCRIETFEATPGEAKISRAFQLKSADKAWTILVRDEVRAPQAAKAEPAKAEPIKPDPARSAPHPQAASGPPPVSPGIELLLDIELDAALRFGCREMPLGEILDLGPGDVVQLDRHIADPVDLVVGDKIVARGEVVLINGNFGLRITEVAAPRKRLESIRCLF